MKFRRLNCLFVFIILSLKTAQAQVYPFIEDFNSMPTLTNPAGWTCTVPGFQVYPIHGTANSNGLTKQMTTLGIAADSVISPLIGPATALSQLSFDYRIMETNLYPSFAHALTAGEKIELFAVSGPLSQLLATIDMSNHVTSTNWTNLVYQVGALAGISGNLKIKVTRTNSDFFADFDNFSLADATGISESVKDNGAAIVYPNPSSNGTILQLKGVEPGKYTLSVVSASGAIKFEKDIMIESKENNDVNASYLANGNYLLELKSKRNNYTIRFVVKE